MADQLNMNGLSLQDSRHAPNGMNGGRSAYIPPHMRGSQRSGPPPTKAPQEDLSGPGIGGSAWGEQT